MFKLAVLLAVSLSLPATMRADTVITYTVSGTFAAGPGQQPGTLTGKFTYDFDQLNATATQNFGYNIYGAVTKFHLVAKTGDGATYKFESDTGGTAGVGPVLAVSGPNLDPYLYQLNFYQGPQYTGNHIGINIQTDYLPVPGAPFCIKDTGQVECSASGGYDNGSALIFADPTKAAIEMTSGAFTSERPQASGLLPLELGLPGLLGLAEWRRRTSLSAGPSSASRTRG